MKAKVLIAFFDTESKKKRNVGDIIDISTARFNEIIRKGLYIEAVEDTKTQSKTAKNEE